MDRMTQVLGNVAVTDSVIPTATEAAVIAGARSKLSRTTAQTVANVVSVPVVFPLLDYDVGGFGAAGGDRLTVPAGQAGTYTVIGGVNWVANGNGTRYAGLIKSGIDVGGSEISPNGVAPVRQNFAVDVVLAVGDYMQLNVYQGSGGNLDISFAMLSLRRVA